MTSITLIVRITIITVLMVTTSIQLLYMMPVSILCCLLLSLLKKTCWLMYPITSLTTLTTLNVPHTLTSITYDYN